MIHYLVLLKNNKMNCLLLLGILRLEKLVRLTKVCICMSFIFFVMKWIFIQIRWRFRCRKSDIRT